MAPRSFQGSRSVAAPALLALALGLACDREPMPAPAPAAIPQRAPEPLPPDVAPPSRPLALEATAAAGEVELSWTGSGDDRGVEGYEVLRDGAPVARVASRQASLGGLRAGDRRCWTVVALDAAGNRSEPSEAACLVMPDVDAPSRPDRLSAVLSGNAAADLRWSPSADDVAVKAYEVLRGGAVVATTAGTTFRADGLAPARSHCYAVRAVDAAGNRSEPSAPACLTAPDVSPPTAPDRLTAKGGPGRVTLAWAPAADDVGVAAYEVLRDGAVVARVREPAAAESGLRTARSYCYAVRALDAAGNASPASGPACAAPPDLAPPTVPAGPSARAESDTALSLRWSASMDDVGVARYEVLRGAEIAARTAATTARIEGLRPAVEYCHAVRACDAAGNCSAPSPPACATTPDLRPPGRVAGVGASPASDRAIAVRWAPTTDDVGVTKYLVRSGKRIVILADPGATSFLDDGLFPATRHCYALVAEDAAGNASAPSAEACATTPDLVPPSAPPELVAYPRSGTQLALDWEAARDDVRVEGYEVLRDGQVIATASATQALVTGLSPETRYCVEVRAHDPAGNRGAPTSACARTAGAKAPAAPWNVRAASTAHRELTLAWDPSPDPGVVYVVTWDGARSGGERPVGTTPREEFKIFGNPAAERHCYRIVARTEDDRESPPTRQVCASAREAAARDERPAGAGGGL